MRTITTLSLLTILALLSAGCDDGVAWPADGHAGAPEVATTPSQAPEQHEPVMAMVNGQPIYMRELHRHLMASFGLTFAAYLVDYELVRQEAERMGVPITDEDIAEEHERNLSRFVQQTDDRAEQERILAQALEQRGMTREQYDIWLRGRALLRLLAEDQVEVTDIDLHDEFERQYGRKVQVRIIRTPTLAGIEQIRVMLDDNEDFAELAREFSTHPSGSNGGLLAPISPKSVHIPLALREAAVAMDEVGEISHPIRVGQHHYVLQLLQVYEPEEADFEVVKDQLRQSVREEKILLLQDIIVNDLRRSADIKMVDPAMREQEASPQSS